MLSAKDRSQKILKRTRPHGFSTVLPLAAGLALTTAVVTMGLYTHTAARWQNSEPAAVTCGQRFEEVDTRHLSHDQSAELAGPPVPPELVSSYRQSLAELIESNYERPQLESHPHKSAALQITMDKQGNVQALDWSPRVHDHFTRAMVRAVFLAQPLPAPPQTKSGLYAVVVRAHGPYITVEEARAI